MFDEDQNIEKRKLNGITGKDVVLWLPLKTLVLVPVSAIAMLITKTIAQAVKNNVGKNIHQYLNNNFKSSSFLLAAFGGIVWTIANALQVEETPEERGRRWGKNLHNIGLSANEAVLGVDNPSLAGTINGRNAGKHTAKLANDYVGGIQQGTNSPSYINI